ncbi:hypothetical protein E2C01_028931 [Portunus trituberculatus]|uniref:Uncharacterized protein n=1 Tax=Portunus trituberculatus TaxID=210409 RepID=A0A5B7EQG6_PORTR|nr:hypothetical protein [Portunus trituberculatus]
MLPRAAKVETASPLLTRAAKGESASPVPPRSSKVAAEKPLIRKALAAEATPENPSTPGRPSGKGSIPIRRGLGTRSATAAVIKAPSRDRQGHDASAKPRLRRQDTGIPKLKIPPSRKSVSPRSSLSKSPSTLTGESVTRLRKSPTPTSSTRPSFTQRPGGLTRHNTSVTIRSVPRTSPIHRSDDARGKVATSDTSTAVRRTEAKPLEVRRREKTFIPEARPRLGTSSLTGSVSSASRLQGRVSSTRALTADKKGTSSSKTREELEGDGDDHSSKAPPPSRQPQSRLARLIRRNTEIVDTKSVTRRGNMGLKTSEGRLASRRVSPVSDQTLKLRPDSKIRDGRATSSIPTARRTSGEVTTTSSSAAKQTDGAKLRMRLPKIMLSRTDSRSKKPQPEKPEVAERTSRKSNEALCGVSVQRSLLHGVPSFYPAPLKPASPPLTPHTPATKTLQPRHSALVDLLFELLESGRPSCMYIIMLDTHPYLLPLNPIFFIFSFSRLP